MKRTILLLLFVAFCLLSYAQPSGYYDSAGGLTGDDLKIELHHIIDNHTILSYSAIWSAFYDTDRKDNGKMWDMYSDVPGGTPPYEYTYSSDQCGNYSGEGSCYNREHFFPKSWFNDASPMVTDLFHIYATDGYVNGQRGSFPLGNVGSADWTSMNGSKRGSCSHSDYSGVVFEPIDEYKGDFARTCFYMITRYYRQVSSWSSPMLSGEGFTDWALETLMEWHYLDPVSTKETDRNDAVYSYQDNRNPFIDHPEYVQSIWANVLPEPTHHVIAFEQKKAIELSWYPQGSHTTHYLVLMNTSGCNDFTLPIDGQIYPDSSGRVNIPADETNYTWYVNPTHLTYFFMMVPYSNGSYDYKTDGSVPCTEVNLAQK